MPFKLIIIIKDAFFSLEIPIGLIVYIMHALTSYVSIVGYFNSLMAHLTLFNSDHGPSDYLTYDLNKNKFD